MLQRREKYNLFRNIPVFTQLGVETIKKICNLAVLQDYLKHQVVIREGDLQRSMYLVKEGEFKMSKRVQEQSHTDPMYMIRNRPVRFVDLSLLQVGELFGIEQFREDNRHSFYITCHSQFGSLYVISIMEFKELLIAQSITLPLAYIFNTPCQKQKDQFHQEALTLALQRSVETSKSPSPMNLSPPQSKPHKIRSCSTEQNSYSDKIAFIVRGNSRILKKELNYRNKSELIDESIINKIRSIKMKLKHQSEPSDIRIHTSHDEHLSKIKILNQLGYRPRYQMPFQHRLINYKKLLLQEF